MTLQKILTADEVDALARAHADHEDRGDVERLMETLVDDPVYEFHPLGVQLQGADLVARYYERVRREYAPHVVASALVDLIAATSGAMLEYAIRLRVDGSVRDERLMVVMPICGERFEGERIYSSEGVLRLLLGEMIGETDPIPTPSALEAGEANRR